MDDIIADFLAQHLINLPYVSRAAGLVTVLATKVGGKPRKIPVATLVYKSEEGTVTNCDITKEYHNLVPDGRETGILYFEEVEGAKLKEDGNRRINTWTGKLKLVFWANLENIGNDITIGDLEMGLLSNVPRNISANGSLLGATVKTTKILPKHPSPFEKYTYDETKTLYLTLPYGYTSLEISYKALSSPNCPTNIVLNPEIC